MIRAFTYSLRRWTGALTADKWVLSAAAAINLRRIRQLGPVVAAINALHVAIFWSQWAQAGTSPEVHRWALGMMVTHGAMGCVMAFCPALARRMQHSRDHRWNQVFPAGVAAVGLAFSVILVVLDQWVTPGITPYLLTSALIGLVIQLRPMSAVSLHLLAYTAFYFAIGWTQTHTAQLLSNRLNGVSASILGCALSIVLWRKFVTITNQQLLLERANQDLQQKQRELERLTRLDGLTGLYNRNTFVELVRQELDRAQRQGSNTSVLLLDLDHFKHVNDSHGHPAGDAVLRHVARLVSDAVRGTDLVGRLGGEEFVVLLPATPIAAACTLAEKVRLHLQNSPTAWGGATIANTVSIGVAATTAAQKRNFESLYDEADKSMYQAKQRGRNQVVWKDATVAMSERPLTG
jgi:diguanylate cyclase (GGDEF)-like protein